MRNAFESHGMVVSKAVKRKSQIHHKNRNHFKIKLMKKFIIPVSLFGIALASVAQAQISINSLHTTYSQNFNTFDGTEGSLPSGWTYTVEGFTAPLFRGLQDIDDDPIFTGVMGLTSTGGTDVSIGWRESTNAANLDDFRLLLHVTNNTGKPITAFQFTYDLESWLRGARIQEMRFKYDTVLTDPDRSTFETDILTRFDDGGTLTVNPGAAFSSGTTLNGNNVRTQVSGVLDLATYLIDESDPDAGVFGALGVGESAYFRWQISNVSGDSGNRSVLAINNFTLKAIPEPSSALLLGLGALALLARRMRR